MVRETAVFIALAGRTRTPSRDGRFENGLALRKRLADRTRKGRKLRA